MKQKLSFPWLIPGLAVLALVLTGSGELAAGTLAMGTVTGTCGQQVTVPVTASGAPGLLAAQFKVAYDPSRLTPGTPAAATGGMTSGFSISSNASGGVLSVALASGTPAPGSSGTVALLTFTLASGAPAGSTPLTLSSVLLNDGSASATNGGVDIPSCGPPASEMLLSQGRVGVSCTWRSQWTGKSGVGTPVKQLDSYGYFWFESAEVPEAFVKVLDFPGDAYQIYHTALSDVEYTVTFRVLATGKSYSFRRDAGSSCGVINTVVVKK